MIILASVFGAVSGVAGAYISFIAPAMPTGPWIVIVISTIALISFFFAPVRGVVSRMIRQSTIRKTINDENVLKTLYQLGEDQRDFMIQRHAEEILKRRRMPSGKLNKILGRLENQGYLKRSDRFSELTEEGKVRAQRVVRIHRLWELYLTTQLNIAPDHVHDDADTIEHLLTPELEAELERVLNYPKVDPHKSEIPYDTK
jgi:manganese/zinc/iron transport system permease protein